MDLVKREMTAEALYYEVITQQTICHKLSCDSTLHYISDFTVTDISRLLLSHMMASVIVWKDYAALFTPKSPQTMAPISG